MFERLRELIPSPPENSSSVYWASVAVLDEGGGEPMVLQQRWVTNRGTNFSLPVGEHRRVPLSEVSGE